MIQARSFIPVASPDLTGNERRYVDECVETGWISFAGSFVRRFEEAFAERCRTRYAVTTSSGTAALHLALLALGIGPGDEVLVPAWTFVATANAVVHAAARPVLVDVDESGGIDPDLAVRRITKRTKAVIAVHLYGRPADVYRLRAHARRHGIALLEDAAEAHGAEVGGRPVGSFGRAGCFSLFANKIVTTGEGGILITSSRRVAETARRLRDHGMSRRRKYWHPVIGYSYGMTNLQAAIGVAQLERFDALLKRKDAIADRYARGLRDVLGIEIPEPRPGTRAVCWMFSVLVHRREFGMGRDALMRTLAARGIETRPFFYPLHRMPPYRTAERFPVAERLAAQGVNLPSGPAISDTDIDRVVDTIRMLGRRAQ